MNVYKKIFNGTIHDVSRYGDTFPVDDNYKGKILHARLTFGDNLIMFSDAMQGTEIKHEGGIHMALGLTDEAQANSVFEQLSAGGKVEMPMEKQFWGALYGQVVDVFGIHWMINCELPVKIEKPVKKVTGLGGIFFKCADPKGISQWYAQNLGLNKGDYGISFEWRDADEPEKKGITMWSTFPQDTKYFEPSGKDFMINYRVENLEALVKQLRDSGATITDEVSYYDYGKFVHVLDPEGNGIELWEPKDD